MSATMFDSMMATVSATTMSSRHFVRAQRRWQHGNLKVWRTNLPTDWLGKAHLKTRHVGKSRFGAAFQPQWFKRRKHLFSASFADQPSMPPKRFLQKIFISMGGQIRYPRCNQDSVHQQCWDFVSLLHTGLWLPSDRPCGHRAARAQCWKRADGVDHQIDFCYLAIVLKTILEWDFHKSRGWFIFPEM